MPQNKLKNQIKSDRLDREKSKRKTDRHLDGFPKWHNWDKNTYQTGDHMR